MKDDETEKESTKVPTALKTVTFFLNPYSTN